MTFTWTLLLAAAASFAQQQDPAMKALEEKRYPEAIRLLTEAVTRDPRDPYSQFNLALAYSGANQTTNAIDAYRKTLTLKPKLYEAELNLGIVLVQSRRGAEAVEILEDARAQKPNEFRPAFFLGEALFAANQFEKAEAAYQLAATLNPRDAAAEYGLGRAIIASESGRLDDAAQHYRRAYTLDPRYAAALVDLGGLYEQDKQVDKAIALYRDLPQVPAAQARLGALLIEQNRSEEAVKTLEEAVDKSPTIANQSALVTAYVKAHQTPKALPLLEKLLAASPRDVELLMLRGRIFRDQRNFKAAAGSFYAVTRLQPDSVDAWNEFSAMLISLEEYPSALGALDRLKQLKAERPPHLFFRAIILDKMKQQKPAVEAYKRFLETSQGNYPDQEFQARQRVRIIEHELNKR
jgi:tetratricopeptide (TPR) repeat protein